MKAILQWVVAHRLRMALIAALMSVLPIFSLLAQSIVVVAVLLHGLAEGIWVAALVSLMMGLPVIFAGGSPLPLLGIMALTWLPVLGLAHLLRQTRSLSLVLQVTTVVTAGLVVVAFVVGDPVAMWRQLLMRFADQLPIQLQELPQQATAEVMTGMLGLVALLGSLAAVFIGRWWQAILQKPGAFAVEFRALRLGYIIAIVAGLTFVIAGVTSVTMMTNLTLVFTAAFLLQGLAVVHSLAAATSMGVFWLVSSYAMLVVAAPLAIMALASLGFVDSWFDFRRRLATRY